MENELYQISSDVTINGILRRLARDDGEREREMILRGSGERGTYLGSEWIGDSRDRRRGREREGLKVKTGNQKLD